METDPFTISRFLRSENIDPQLLAEFIENSYKAFEVATIEMELTTESISPHQLWGNKERRVLRLDRLKSHVRMLILFLKYYDEQSPIWTKKAEENISNLRGLTSAQ